MTRASAAQEPSMDEILASIRRIIESSDDGSATASGRATQIRPHGEAGTVLRFAAERDEALSVVESVKSDGEDQPAFGALDEDDLAQRLSEEFEAEARGDLAAFDEPATFVDADADARAAFEDEPEAPASRAASNLRERSGEIAGPALSPANSDDPHLRDFRNAVLDDAGREAKGETLPLVSGRTGELVGASFDELARAIREGELRSLEDMAQEMLRPMLQDWLDDNLPRLVERLVREEIERVARGGRR